MTEEQKRAKYGETAAYFEILDENGKLVDCTTDFPTAERKRKEINGSLRPVMRACTPAEARRLKRDGARAFAAFGDET